MPSKYRRKLDRLATIDRALYNHRVAYATLLLLQPTNVNWRAVYEQSRQLYAERDKIVAWFERNGYPCPNS